MLRPAYRACRWETQDEANRGWVARLLPLLEVHATKVAKRLAELYEKPLDGLPIRTDMVEMETVDRYGSGIAPRPMEGARVR